MANLIGLDFETYGAEDLPTHGLARYARHKTFQPLIGSVALRDTRGVGKTTFDFVSDRRGSVRDLADLIDKRIVCAHNAPFEQMVLDTLGIALPSHRFIDSAVVARAAGGGSRLEAAAPQLLDVDKMEEGRNLIKLFSIPGAYQERAGSQLFDPQIIEDHPDEWATFVEYCELDAELSLRLVEDYSARLGPREVSFQALTMDMNRAGWCVDVPLVEEMQRRYLENQAQALHDFRLRRGAEELNLNSLPQMKAWCAERGVKAYSFDEKNVARLLSKLGPRISALPVDDPKRESYIEVEDLLVTKQVLGGSSLKKLQVILDTAVDMGDGTHRLFDQYIHAGAGQSCRTSGRSVQMQNLKRLAHVDDVTELLTDPGAEWDNARLAENIRQCFTASHPQGRLLVGDFSSVESRGLAYLAGADWKLIAYRSGKDMYKVLASQMFSIPYNQVDKGSPERQAGKVGELSCGYGAGAGAVQSFAEGMGITMNEAEAAKLVFDWRETNPEIVGFWRQLDSMLDAVLPTGSNLNGGRVAFQLPDNLKLELKILPAPPSLQAQLPGARSLKVAIYDRLGEAVLKRYFHGVHRRGRNIGYFKPSDRKTGELWKNRYTDPKTKQVRFYELYGGKLAGILTQSFCREIFFRTLAEVCRWAVLHSNQLSVVGQFHDEIVADWRPGPMSLELAKSDLEQLMSDPGQFTSFPLAAEIKDDYRYTK